VDAILYEKILDPGSYEASQELSQKQHLYEFEFVASEPLPDDFIYQLVDKSMFKNFRVKSVSMKNLGIKRVEHETFGVKCCQNTLESIDLSGNKLVRFDSNQLINLKRLERIDLSNNNLQFGDANFEHNRNLRVINLSGNQLQYLPYRLFEKLTELESIDLSNNQLQSVQACTFNRVQLSPISRQYNPTRVSLLNNPLDCDCGIFYMSRHLNMVLNLTCSKPEVYAGRRFDQLKQEDPSFRCQYARMEKNCNVKENLIEIIVIIVLACLAGLFFTISLACLCKNVAGQNNMKKLKKEIENNKKPKIIRPKPVYVNSTTGVLPNSNSNSDKEKLLA
jgi:Leucine-rich repeat (LRR) protein